MNIEQRIQQLRKEKGLSQEQLAEQLNISRQAISKWESGQSLPDIDKIVALSEYFGVTTDYILKGTDKINQTTQTAQNTTNQKIANGLNILTTFLLVVGLLATIANWYENQTMKDVLGGLVIQATGVASYFVGKMFSATKVSNRWLWCNGMIFLFVPVSLIMGLFWSYPKPYPTDIFEMICFAVLYAVAGGLLHFGLKKYRK